jgi:hypothetical protein
MAKHPNNQVEVSEDKSVQAFKPAFSTKDLNLPDTETVFNNPDIGETFGGQFDRMEILPGEITPYLQFVRISSMILEDIVDGKIEAKTVQIVVARTEDGKMYSHPIGAIFIKNFKDAAMVPGDIFLYKRGQDVKIKKGRGAGKEVPSFEIKVVLRHKAV